jgi:tRNA dimethylallyltransferase
MITILGPTATGKTSFAAYLAYKMNGEIISADSRQVFIGMDIGTGKDRQDYMVEGNLIPAHLVDIREPGEEFSVFDFQEAFLEAYQKITRKNKIPILCGGTGLYLESVLKGYHLQKVPKNQKLRARLITKSFKELQDRLLELKPNQHNTTDLNDRERLVRAIEIQEYYKTHGKEGKKLPEFNNTTFGIHFERKKIRQRITERLHQRLENGMVEEVGRLLQSGLTADQLRFYGLEYRYITDFLTLKIDRYTMVNQLETAIHQFAKRQMTWFRRMERNGITIHWIDGNLNKEEKLQQVTDILSSNT